MKTLEEKRKYHREYMRKYNRTLKGAKYNREHSHKWRKLHKKPHNKNRKPRTVEYRAIIVDFLLKRDGAICGFCKESLENSEIHIDHKIPVAFGGPHTMENSRLAHAKCNYTAALVVRKKLLGY